MVFGVRVVVRFIFAVLVFFFFIVGKVIIFGDFLRVILIILVGEFDNILKFII